MEGDERHAETEERIAEAVALLARARRVVALTGAGVSSESGLPTFRGPGGMWKRRRPEELATPEAFLADPRLVWSWYRHRALAALAAEPNAAHRALADFEKLVSPFLLVTQNVDDLHRRAGSKRIAELHGNIMRFRCFDRGHPHSFDPSWSDDPPRCRCGSLVRPGVVWFGEPLPEDAVRTAWQETAACDLLLVVGTSCAVYPAASLPALALETGAAVVEVNVEPTPATAEADVFIEGSAAGTLPRLVERLSAIRGKKGGDVRS